MSALPPLPRLFGAAPRQPRPLLADILGVEVDESLVNAAGKLEIGRAGLLTYAHGTYYELGKALGTFGYSVRKKPARRGRK